MSVARALYNFAKASRHDAFLFGSARPGPENVPFKQEEKVSTEDVQKWADFMQSKGMQQVVTLMTQKELTTYSEPLGQTLQKYFKKHTVVDPNTPSATKEVMGLISEAASSGDKVLIHCKEGHGRTGGMLASWLMQTHKLAAQQAADEIINSAQEQGALRKLDVSKLGQ